MLQAEAPAEPAAGGAPAAEQVWTSQLPQPCRACSWSFVHAQPPTCLAQLCLPP